MESIKNAEMKHSSINSNKSRKNSKILDLKFNILYIVNFNNIY